MAGEPALRAEQRAGGWVLAGPAAAGYAVVNDYLGYLVDRRYSPRTIRAYAFDLLHLVRWLLGECLRLEQVTTDVLLRYLGACRSQVVAGRPGGNVYSIRDGRNAGLAPATINRRLAAVAGLFAYWQLRDPAVASPVPRGAAARAAATAGRGGRLGHLASPRARSRLRVRQPRRLPRGLDRAETAALLASFRTTRDRAIAGLMLFSGLRSAEVLGLKVRDVDIGRGWVRVVGKGDKERRVPVDRDVAGLIQAYLLGGRPATDARELFVVAKGPNRGRPLSAAGLRTIFRYHRQRAGVPAGHPHALRHSFGTALAEAGVDLAVLQQLMGHDHVDSAAAYIHLAPRTCAPPTTTPAPASAPTTPPMPPAPTRLCEPAAELLAAYTAQLTATGRGSRAYTVAARSFLARWPDPQAWAAEPLGLRLGAGSSTWPLLNFLMLFGHLRPGYDYLLERKLSALPRELGASPLGPELEAFVAAAAELGYSQRARLGMASQVAARVRIQTGRPLTDLAQADLDAFEAAIADREQRHNRAFKHYRSALYATRAVIYHLGGGVEPAAKNTPRQWSWEAHLDRVPEPLRRELVAYLECCVGTRTRSTVSHMASRLAHFGHFLADLDPDLTSLGGLDRQRHIEPWLHTVAEARHRHHGTPLSASERRSRILTVARMLHDLTDWGWAQAPRRRLVSSRDIPRLPRPLPRYLPPDADRRLAAALAASPNRLRADALLLLRATGLRIGELCDLELDCVHEVQGQGAWLKVPLGKLDTERMVPLDDETLDLLDRIAAHRSPGRPLRHPRTGRMVEFLLTHQGRRVSKDVLRDELARAADQAGLGPVTPHQLRHTYATALVNAGVSLQALMALLGHVSAAMSLRYGRLFDATVRADYEKALALAKERLGPVLPQATPVELHTDWRQAPLIKARLAGGYCLRTAAQGVCPYTNVCEHCPNFRSDTGFLPILAAQRTDAEALARDAEARGWGKEAARHRQLVERLDQLMNQARQHPLPDHPPPLGDTG